MLIHPTNAKRLLQSFDFRTLFIEELGWDHHTSTLQVAANDDLFALNAIAHKRGMVAYVCAPTRDGRIPDYRTRRQIETQVAKVVREHLIIYTDANKTTQVWQWVKREAGKPLACREHTFHRNQSGDSLIQKLDAIAFSLAEEEALTLVDVTARVRAGFDVERVTKRFYDRFKIEHDAFLKFVTGIPDAELERWYVSVMLNRLMFIYFIQKKGFLDGDTNYLRHRLAESQRRGKDRFYRDFLCPLFFEGFAKRESERSAAMNALLGKVPYLNGGIFLPHPIEQAHGKTIQISDAAFARLFDFFEQYQWHLDERPLRNDNEINPDVLGYIFEKYINQKQMGAYYTKEDITGYISQNTIIPFLFDAAHISAPEIVPLLQADPDRYIYDAIKHGATLPLPPEIAAGLNDVSKRTEWNKPAPAEYALPTEIWREVIARRQRYEEVKSKIATRAIENINDFITYNLNIRQFAQDVIAHIDDPARLRAFWHALENISVLDPTVGSGAFLFAALDILESLYEACLDRMQAFVDDLERSGEKHRPEKFGDFREVLARVAQHPNRKYFVYKSIVVNNLYGVDIMEEAVEICKLRLFLKLVAQVERVEDIEPLPDIDFNIRAGNSLVGFATYDEVKRAVTTAEAGQMKMLSNDDLDTMQRIDERAEIADRAFQMFREMQTKHEMEPQEFAQAKQTLRQRLHALEEELNGYLAKQYGVDPIKKAAFAKWRTSHKPFHWFIEFYGILKRGGFDVIIGNPPYVEYSKVKSDYTVRGYVTESCGNLYAFMMERSFKVMAYDSRFGMIVPLSLATTERMSSLQSLIVNSGRWTWLSFYDVYPCKLFEGAKQRLSIVLTSGISKQPRLFTTKYNRWKPEERESLIQKVHYWKSFYDRTRSVIPKLQNKMTESLLTKVSIKAREVYIDPTSHVSFYVHRIPYNYVKAFDFIPYFWNTEDGEKKSEDYKPYCLRQRENERAVLASLSSNLFFWWWYTLFEGYHCGRHEIYSFPIGMNEMSAENRNRLEKLAVELMQDVRKNKKRKTAEYKNTGKVVYDEFYPRYSKPIIDEIDRVLARHYGFTDEELDFIINYDIKYRMGKDAEE